MLYVVHAKRMERRGLVHASSCAMAVALHGALSYGSLGALARCVSYSVLTVVVATLHSTLVEITRFKM